MAVSKIENGVSLPDNILTIQNWGTVKSGQNIVKNITSTQRFLLVLTSASSSRNTMWLVNLATGSSSNAVNLGSASTITVTPASGKITLSTSDSNNTYAYVIVLNGDGVFT